MIHNFSFTGNEQSLVLNRGYYFLEAWGAQGGTCNVAKSGLGGYTRGFIKLFSSTKIIVIVGGAGQSSSTEASEGGYNGGGKSMIGSYKVCGSSGGGSTDILIESNGKREKVIIAGGGGGSIIYDNIHYKGGFGGGYNGSDGAGQYYAYAGKGGKQTYYENGGSWGSIRGGFGQLGQGGDGNAQADASTGGGGGGYYGGGGGADVGSGAGGSGYLSKRVIRGLLYQDDSYQMYGREGNGYARISQVKSFCTCVIKRNSNISLFMLFIVLLK